MKKAYALLALLIAVTIVCAALVSIDYAKYEEYKQEIISEHPEIEPWIDFNPYFVHNPWALGFVCAVVVAWLVLIGFAVRKVTTHAV